MSKDKEDETSAWVDQSQLPNGFIGLSDEDKQAFIRKQQGLRKGLVPINKDAGADADADKEDVYRHHIDSRYLYSDLPLDYRSFGLMLAEDEKKKLYETKELKPELIAEFVKEIPTPVCPDVKPLFDDDKCTSTLNIPVVLDFDDMKNIFSIAKEQKKTTASFTLSDLSSTMFAGDSEGESTTNPKNTDSHRTRSSSKINETSYQSFEKVISSQVIRQLVTNESKIDVSSSKVVHVFIKRITISGVVHGFPSPVKVVMKTRSARPMYAILGNLINNPKIAQLSLKKKENEKGKDIIPPSSSSSSNLSSKIKPNPKFYNVFEGLGYEFTDGIKPTTTTSSKSKKGKGKDKESKEIVKIKSPTEVYLGWYVSMFQKLFPVGEGFSYETFNTPSFHYDFHQAMIKNDANSVTQLWTYWRNNFKNGITFRFNPVKKIYTFYGNGDGLAAFGETFIPETKDSFIAYEDCIFNETIKKEPNTLRYLPYNLDLYFYAFARNAKISEDGKYWFSYPTIPAYGNVIAAIAGRNMKPKNPDEVGCQEDQDKDFAFKDSRPILVDTLFKRIVNNIQRSVKKETSVTDLADCSLLIIPYPCSPNAKLSENACASFSVYVDYIILPV